MTTKNLLTDEELVKRCQEELPYITTSFEALVNRYKDKVYGKALSMLRHPQDAEDAAQDIFLRVFNGLPNFHFNAAFNTWLTAITTNTCLTYIEKRRRKPWWWLTEDLDEVQGEQAAEQSLFLLVGKSLEQEDMQRAIENTMQRLTETSREILRLRFWEELDYQAIAERLHIKLSAVKMRIKRAREEFISEYQKNKER